MSVKGPKGELTQEVDEKLGLEYAENVLTVTRPNDDKDMRPSTACTAPDPKHGCGCDRRILCPASNGGCGLPCCQPRAALNLSLGYSHPIILELPKEIKVEAETKKVKHPR